MKKTLASIALALLLALPTSAFASDWQGDPSQIDEEPSDIVVEEEAPSDIYEDYSPSTGDSSLVLLYAGISGAALLTVGVAMKKRAASHEA